MATESIKIGSEGVFAPDKHIKSKLLKKIQDRSAVVGVVGLGYVGLPFAVEKAKAGYQVIGIEQNSQRVKMLQAGQNYIQDVDDESLKQLVEAGKIISTTDYASAAAIDVVVIAVPTPLTKNLTPDLRYIESVSKDVTKHLRPGQLICLESTTYPGTTEEVMLSILECSGLKVEKDFYLAHSPERVDPGNKRYTTKNTNKVVGGVGPHSLEVASAFYAKTIDEIVPVSSAKSAELVKVFENTFRAVNIALVNEMTLLCDRMKLNVWEVLDAAFTKPFGIMPFYPSPGVGGHCIPIDPHYLEWKAKELNFNTHFIALAGEINRKMPEFVKEKAFRLLNENGIPILKSKILIIGVAYKKDVNDYRESPALHIIKLLMESGSDVVYHDPYVPHISEDELDMSSVTLSKEIISESDLVIIITDHVVLDYAYIGKHANHILDTRNAMKYSNVNKQKVVLL